MDDIFSKKYKELNNEQKIAVDTIDGPVMVVAGPGTGKTQILALRVANILKKTGAAPSNILCLTFTEAGAHNMRERLQQFIGQDAYRVGIYTFHAFCNSIISRYPEYFYNSTSYSLAGDLDRVEIIDELFNALPHGHPLASQHPELGYVYRGSILERIKHIKNGGFAPDEYIKLVEALIAEHNVIHTVLCNWPERLAIKQIEDVVRIQQDLLRLGNTYGAYLSKTLEIAIDSARELGKMEAVGNWKKKYTEKDEHDVVVLKDSKRVHVMRAVAEFYQNYTKALHARGMYDYDDLIIEVTHTLETDSIIRNELEEQYQYILIDEFQDTNEAQMRLVRAITSHEIHNGQPNVMTVGDDDQAIYKFQGAEVSNINDFRKTYKNVRVIVLDKNYRSHQRILDYARDIVIQGKNRLEGNFEDITKKLSQGNEHITHSEVIVNQFSSDTEEYAVVTGEIKKLIDSGKDPNEIAVIARKHAVLSEMLPYLDREKIHYEYTKRSNVFDEPHIQELIHICNYVASIANSGSRRDDLLPIILSFPYFGIPRSTIFNIAVKSKDLHISWAEFILNHEHDARIHDVFKILVDIGAHAETLPLEHLINTYIHESGFRDHYFSKEIMRKQPILYVNFLASLKTFIGALREWREGEPLFARDVEKFVSLHKTERISLICESPVVQSKHSVKLMTAHGAKGLEFDAVFIIGSDDTVWTKRGKMNIATIPAPLVPLITPAGDDEDDFIRLFYVAITRAKQILFISGHNTLLRYLNQKKEEISEINSNNLDEQDIIAYENTLNLISGPYKEEERTVLSRVVGDYKLSITHLNNFINVVDGGPLFFIEQDLLRFPQPKSASSVFGSAIDSSLTELIRFRKFNGIFPELVHILGVFNKELSRGRLPEVELKRQRARGERVLSEYYTQRELCSEHGETQVSIGGIVIGGAPVTGRIDLLDAIDGGLRVTDFKTGRAYNAWDGKLSEHEKIKLYKYKQQLIFYKLLLENSEKNAHPVHSLVLEFVEGIIDGGRRILLPYDPTKEDIERMTLLIGAVYKKVTSLDFPDISHYEKNLKGIITFGDDLINGSI
ncbi:ATP-dependent helicase [Candidatus Parcubacteria bacterium]|jgi:DNA helicase-2/ATP-dependent DNA helicase PcrA|nr:MAG: ATP-dependent helicase [Candidatus Parcubacteria bacterium]